MINKKFYKNLIKKNLIKKILIIPSFVNLKIFFKITKIKKEYIEKSLKLLNFKIKNIINGNILMLVLEYINIIAYKKLNINNKIFKINKKLFKRDFFVTFTGHVDSGKTSIIKNLITKNNIKENSGITQSINFYNFKYKKNIILIDTPGHEDFNNFRKNGLKITDLIILLISVKDNFNRNFENIIKYIKNFKIPIIIILNKTDIINLKYNYVINLMLSKNLIKKKNINTIYFLKSNINNKKNIKSIINLIIGCYKFINSKIDINKFFIALVIENKNFKKFGLLTTIFIKSGKIKKGDIIIFNNNYYKIKFFLNKENKFIENSKKDILIKLSGLSKLIKPGDIINKINNNKFIKNIINCRNKKINNLNNYKNYKIIEDLKSIQNIKNDNINIINIILILNDENILTSIKKNLYKISNNYVKIKIIEYYLSNINISIIKKSIFLKSYLINFKNKISNKNFKILKHFKVKFKSFENIYQLNKYINLIKNYILFKKKMIGKAIINKIFKTKNGLIAGCKILKGFIKINSRIKLFRKKKLLYKGKIESLNHLKSKVFIVKKNNDCGIAIKNFDNFVEDDIIYIYNE